MPRQAAISNDRWARRESFRSAESRYAIALPRICFGKVVTGTMRILVHELLHSPSLSFHHLSDVDSEWFQQKVRQIKLSL
jgi:hypothetical protein